MSRPIHVIQAEFERERDKLIEMNLDDPRILRQSQLVDLLHMELVKAERGFACAS